MVSPEPKLQLNSLLQVEYIARFVEEPELDRPDKLEGIKGMLEGVVDVRPTNSPRAYDR